MPKLLTRDAFKNAVFARDRHRCVIPSCEHPAQDAHHIIERRLWPDGGYYLDNGASVCEDHHLQAETTEISASDLRMFCGIKTILLPDHLSTDEVYDKWGNPILPNGMRLRGELFEEESVQRTLAPVIHLFTNRVKYPRTFHLPWSPGVHADDRVIASTAIFEGRRVVVTVKMDGENTTMYPDYLHTRSLEYQAHPSRDRVRALHGQIAHEIPFGFRLCGENLFAKHSIHYKALASYFLLFSVWNERNVCLSWDDTKLYAELLGLKTVPVIYDGVWDEAIIQKLYSPLFNGDECEGYVVRTADEFSYRNFRHHVAKYVRNNHVTTVDHWKHQTVVPNGVVEDER